MDHLFYDGGEAAGGEHDVLHLKSSWSQELERHEHLSKVVEQIMERYVFSALGHCHVQLDCTC